MEFIGRKTSRGRISSTGLIHLLVVCLAAFAAGCAKAPDRVQSPIDYTNAVVDGKDMLLVSTTNNVWMTVYSNSASLNIGYNQSVTVHFNPSNRVASRIIVELVSNGTNLAISDSNADGIPDMRRVKGKTEVDLFYRGRWLKSTPAGESGVKVLDEGVEKTLKFVEGRWKGADDE